jgi:pyruvate-formate lyase-activating enzyme
MPAASDAAPEAHGPRSGFLPARVLHLHPTLTCNLACSHCYSASAPQQRGHLAAARWQRALPWLRAQGYEQVSLSGGEPLVHPEIDALVAASRAAGLRVTLISNGLLLADARHDALVSQLDGLAISFDGLAPVHNRLRGRPDAFARASAAVARLAARGVPVAAAISVSRAALPGLPALAEHLVGLGARALQLRPVARAGRAQALADDTFCRPVDVQRLYLVALALQQELAPQVKVQCDLAPTTLLATQRSAYAALLAECAAGRTTPRLSDWVNPLVITERGVLRPIAYDFDPRHDLGTLEDAGDALLPQLARTRLPGLRQLVGQTLGDLPAQGPLVDWFDHLTRRSAARSIPVLPQPA